MNSKWHLFGFFSNNITQSSHNRSLFDRSQVVAVGSERNMNRNGYVIQIAWQWGADCNMVWYVDVSI